MRDVFLRPDNTLLYTKAKVVSKTDLKNKWFLNIIRKMKEVAGVNQHGDMSRPIMVGLAAPQIGYPYQIIFVDISAKIQRGKSYGENIFMVNPVVKKYSKERLKGREGCYSTKLSECDVRGMVNRSTKVLVEYMTIAGDVVTQEFSGFTAVIIQHEVDHVNGKVFVHRITNKNDLHIVFPTEYKKYKKECMTWARTLDPKIYFKDIAKL